MKTYREHCIEEIEEQDPPLAVTRLIDHPIMPMAGLVTVARIRTEKVRAGFSKTQSNLANITSIPLMLQRETEN